MHPLALPSVLYVCMYSVLCVAARQITGHVQWNDVCPGIETLRHSKVILNSGVLQASITRNGTFAIADVPEGTYILHVISPDVSFDQLRLDVHGDDSEPEIRHYAPGTPLNPKSPITLRYPIVLTPRQKHDYFVPLESFNLMAMLSNPMMLMMILALVMMLATPYLMSQMDPEAMEEFKEQHARVQELQGAMTSGDLKSGLTALLGGGGGDAPKPASAATLKTAPSASSKARGSKNKKR